MQVFKFGGASVKEPSAIINVQNILTNFAKEPTVVIISAMGKTTNMLEDLVKSRFFNPENTNHYLSQIKEYHYNIVASLFADKNHSLYTTLNNHFVSLEWELEDTQSYPFDQVYDQIVSMGEILSTAIVSAYLNEKGLKNYFLDVRDVVKTDETYREGTVNWDLTEKLITTKIADLKKQGYSLIITQGFLGGTADNFTTTLGREGSDYTAAIFAYCLNASGLTIWKDVPGVLNADPKWFDNTVLLDQISYQDSIELAYYGASVIHPKTIKPLQNKHIPLYVKSFVNPEKTGTVINDVQSKLNIPCFIFKVNQVLLSISPKDFSFIVEENLSQLFKTFSDAHIKINSMQNSAISFSVCVDNDPMKLPALLEKLKQNYRVLYNQNVELVTIRYYDQATIDRVMVDKTLLLEVKSRYTVQLVVKPNEISSS